MKFSRAPNAVLQPFVELIWAADGFETPPEGSGRELVLPTGKVHIVFRIDGPPLRLFRDAADVQGQLVGSSLIGVPARGPTFETYRYHAIVSAQCSVPVLRLS